MPHIEVARLKLSCGAEHLGRTRFAVEDGLRTCIPDERRLVLVRRMQLDPNFGTLQPAYRQTAISNGWLAAVAGARHGGDDGAESANCVWFASRDEAECLLLERLLAGRAVNAWYWKLALPDWRGRDVRTWATECVAVAVEQREWRRLLGIVECFLRVAAAGKLVELLSSLSGDAPGAGAVLKGGLPCEPATDLPTTPADAASEIAGAFVAAALPTSMRDLLAALAREGAQGRTATLAIARAWALRRSPALSLSPGATAAAVDAVLEAAASPASRRRRSRAVVADETPPTDASPTAAPFEPAPNAPEDRPEPCRQGKVKRDSLREGGEDSSEEAPGTSGVLPQVAPTEQRRLRSSHAGLWLVVPSLLRLGWREWLAGHPQLLAMNPGATLLHEIARHHRVPLGDAALLALALPPEADHCPEWARVWRHGLDRWLRRTARRRLHDLVNRAGELDITGEAVTVHYPPDAADLALRRLALDRDPGWTDWLGLSIRYNFAGTENWL